MHRIEVHFTNGGVHIADVPGKSNLLDELEKQNINIARGCLSGACGVCRMEILEGKENFHNLDFVERDTVTNFAPEPRKWRLACCAKVKGNAIIRCEQEV